MKKPSIAVFVFLLFASVFHSNTGGSFSGKDLFKTVELTSLSFLATLEDAIDNAIGIKVSEIIGRIAILPARIIDSSPLVSSFVKSIVEIGLKYASKKVNMPLKYLLFTPLSPNTQYDLEISKKSIDSSTFNPSLDTKFLIPGLATDLVNSSVYFDIKNGLLQTGNYNVIAVNWSEYNDYPYTKASINAVFAGFEISKLMQLLMDTKGVSPSSFHLIGHSLGAQICGFAAKVTPKIGRISGLDAAGPIFEYLPKFMRLTNTDADLVDAIHTNGATSVLEGFGTIYPYGDIDFFPNGGSAQPGCSTGDTYFDANKKSQIVNNPYKKINCNHERALFLYLESINVCQFNSVQCTSYQAFKDKKCPKNSSKVSMMGFYAMPSASLPPYSTFYLETSDKSPFCIQN